MSLGVIASGTVRTEFVDINVSSWAWFATIGVIVALLLFDILILNRHAHAPTMRRAALETIAWVAIGVTFGIVVIASFGSAPGGEWFSGYLIEYSLSIDNVFVWALILAYFQVPARYQRRVLFWGVFGALVLRAGFIFAGVALITRFEWMLFIFGAFLIFTGIRMAFHKDAELHPEDNPLVKGLKRFMPVTQGYHGARFFE